MIFLKIKGKTSENTKFSFIFITALLAIISASFILLSTSVTLELNVEVCK